MAGSEQRPTDDVLGHGTKRPEDEMAGAGGDRGTRRPDDVSGHARYRPGEDNEATDEDQVGDDSEGHGSRFNG
jgi:hypothetical protein